ncbi:unnamed protein product, partial [Mesorhabditis belari]|uniref:Phospholipid/glycerol acyltransferase domain-containing protein n=1 Tax=Mesorhabditis belari TaxID=2138241 RepID=A0AAF3FGM8_9BILA
MGEPTTVSRADGWRQRVNGWLFGFFVLTSSLFGTLYFFLPFVPLMFLAPRIWRQYIDRLSGYWTYVTAGMIRLLFGVKTRVIGDKIEAEEMALYIMNHRTSLDWLFFWNALYQQDPRLTDSQKVILKSSEKYLPGGGWAMQCNSFIFLERNFQKDKMKIRQLLDYYTDIGNSYQLLLFPEGTDRCPKGALRNERYAAKMDLKPYSYVLHPRTKGFVYIVQEMRRSGKLKAIYDITVGYKDKIVQKETDIVFEGLAPQDVHFQIIRIPIEQLPDDDRQLVEWIEKRWANKEEKLRQFYEAPRGETFENTPQGAEYELTPDAERMSSLGIIACAGGTVLWMLGLLPFSSMFSWFSFCGVLFYLIVPVLFGGVEFLAIEGLRFSKGWTKQKRAD